MKQHQPSNVLYELHQIEERLRTTYNDLSASPCNHAIDHALDRLNIEIALGRLIELETSMIGRAQDMLDAHR